MDGDAAALAAAGLVMLAAGVVASSARLVAWSLATLGGAYALALAVADADLDARAGFVAAGLLLSGELALWSVEAHRWRSEETAVARARLGATILLALAAATIGTLLVAAGAAVPTAVGLVQVVGMLGAVGALLTLALLGRRG